MPSSLSPMDRAQQLFRTGSAFWNSYCDIANSLHYNQDFSLFGPLFVNLSFSGELYLKTLLLLENGTSIRGHHLDKLFNQVPINVRSMVETKYNSKIKESHMHSFVANARPDLNFRLVPVLKEAAKTFELWRYPGEDAPLNMPGPLELVVKSIQDFLCEKHVTLLSALQFPLRTTGVQVTAIIGKSA